MQQYLNLLQTILDQGEDQFDERTGVGTRFLWGHQLHFDLTQGFPLVTTKRVYFKGVIHELLWMIKGDTNIRYLNLNKVGIWNEWPFRRYLKANNLPTPPPNSEQWNTQLAEFVQKIIDPDPTFAYTWGNIGPNYGYQWRHFDDYLDQLGSIVEKIKAHSTSRRLLVTAWDPRVIDELDAMSLPPCHYTYQFKVFAGKLYGAVLLRSWDTFLGAPFNIAQYALLTHMVAHVANLQPVSLVVTGHDVHLYQNHLEHARLQLTRQPKTLPVLRFARPIDSIDDFHPEDILLEGYDPHPSIKAEVAV